jgi:hypothetical protein
MGTLARAAQFVNARQRVRALDGRIGFDEPDEPGVKAARKQFDYVDEDGDSGRDDNDNNADDDDGPSDAEPARLSTGGRGSLLSIFDASRRRESDAHGRHHQTALGFATKAGAMVSLAFVTNGFADAVELSQVRLPPDSPAAQVPPAARASGRVATAVSAAVAVATTPTASAAAVEAGGHGVRALGHGRGRHPCRRLRFKL